MTMRRRQDSWAAGRTLRLCIGSYKGIIRKSIYQEDEKKVKLLQRRNWYNKICRTDKNCSNFLSFFSVIAKIERENIIFQVAIS